MFREDIGQDASVEALEEISGKKRQAKLDAIRAACQGFIYGDLITQLSETLAGAVGKRMAGAKVELDQHDESAQSLLLWYPRVTAGRLHPQSCQNRIRGQIRSRPSRPHSVVPYLADDLPALDLTVANVTIVDAERTFWDKVIIHHGLRRWFDARQVLRAGGQRVSRHYYDVHQLMITGTGASAIADPELGRDCVAHARMFFYSSDVDLAHAKPGSFSMMPTDAMITDLRRDYAARVRMIFGDVPDLDAILATVDTLKRSLNEPAA